MLGHTPVFSPHDWSDDTVLYAPAAGPAPFNPFLAIQEQWRSQASPPRTDRSLCLPAEALVFGFRHTHGPTAGQPRWEAAVLSVFAWFWRRSRGHAATIPYRGGPAVEVGPGAFVVSIATVASIVWARVYRRPVPAEKFGDPQFAAFYQAVREAVLRLREKVVGSAPLLTWLGPARTDVPGKASDAFGQLWTLDGSVAGQAGLALCARPGVLFYEDVEQLYEEIEELGMRSTEGHPLECSAYPHLCAMDYVKGFGNGGAMVDIACVYDVLTAKGVGLHSLLVEARAKTGRLDAWERAVNAIAWQRNRASGRRWGSAHVTVGAWRKGQSAAEDRRDRPCAVPFLVADVDGPTPECSLVVVRLLLGRLVELGVRPRDLVVSYTGGRGYHVRIPHGLVGRPAWPRAGDVSRVLARFFDRLCDGLETPDGPVLGSLDAALFSPLHLARAVGSEHERAPGRRCVAYRGDDLLELLNTLGPDGVLDIVESNSRSPEPIPFSFPDPDRPAAVPALVAMLQASVEDARAPLPKGESATAASASQGIIAAIRRGVRPGEEFAPNHVGRNKAAYLLALNLLTHGRLDEVWAWAALQQWNAANPVPLGAAEGDDDGELERVFASACKRVSSNAS